MNYIKLIIKNCQFILTLGILIAVFCLVFTVRQPVKYNTSLSLLITRMGSQQTEDYKYDGYYVIKASDEFSKNVQYWLKSPEVVTAIYKKAEVDLKTKNFRQLSKVFKVKKMASQYIEVRFSADKEEEARKIASAIGSILQERAAFITASTWQTVAFVIKAGEPIIIPTKPNPVINSIIGLISGLILGILAIILKREFSKS